MASVMPLARPPCLRTASLAALLAVGGQFDGGPGVSRVGAAGSAGDKRAVRWDVGMLQADALGSDQLATLQALEQLQADLPRQLNEEVAWIRAQDDQVAVLGDIPRPLPSWPGACMHR